MNYRDLLAKYISYVTEQEGTSFIAGYGGDPERFSADEWAELERAYYGHPPRPILWDQDGFEIEPEPCGECGGYCITEEQLPEFKRLYELGRAVEIERALTTGQHPIIE